MKTKLITTLFSVFGIAASHAVLLDIESAYTESKGSNTTITNGVAANIGTGLVGEFKMVEAGGTTHIADMRVTYTGTSGRVLNTSGGTNSGVSILQTVNSQGFTKKSTLTVLLNFQQTPLGNASGDLNFEFFEPGTSFATTLPLQINLTAYDIDFSQFMTLDGSLFNTAILGSLLSTSGSRTYFDPTGMSNVDFTDANAGVVVNANTAVSEFDVTIGTALPDAAFTLFVFDFAIIPEPSAALLGGLGVLALLRRRRVA